MAQCLRVKVWILPNVIAITNIISYLSSSIVIYVLTSGEQSDSGNAAAPILSTGASRDDLIDLILSNWVLQLRGSHSILVDFLDTFDIFVSLK